MTFNIKATLDRVSVFDPRRATTYHRLVVYQTRPSKRFVSIQFKGESVGEGNRILPHIFVRSRYTTYNFGS